MITDSILSFIEDIVLQHGLEKKLIAEDLLLKKKIEETADRSEWPIIKIFYGEKIRERMAKGEKVEDILPSAKLKNIIYDLIEKKLSYDNLPTLIEKELKISTEISKKISESIEKSQEIKNAPLSEEIIELENNDSEDTPEKNTEDDIKKKSIGYELLK